MNFSILRNIVIRSSKSCASLLFCTAFLASCSDDMSKIGPALTEGDTSITLDSISYNLDAHSVINNNFDARSGNLLLGSLDTKEYGKLTCSFVTKLMCATQLSVPDSLMIPERVDSCKLLFGISRGDITGDSLTPQKLAVYRLTRQLPANITNSFDPTGYYDPSTPLGTLGFTASLISQSDSAFLKSKGFYIEIPINKELGQEVFKQYKENPEVFQWPQTFAEYFPGIYVNPFFGKGCVSNIKSIFFAVYYHTFKKKTTTVDGETTTEWVRTAAVDYPFSSSPEVLSSNNISYVVSDWLTEMAESGKSLLTTPGGYLVRFIFPAEDLIARYKSGDHNLSLVNNLYFSISAEVIENEYGIGVTPNLLLIKTSEMNDFFANNKLPDQKTSFTATYDAINKKYSFSSMREYILNLIDKGNLTPDDVDFTIVPVEITQEVETNPYSGATTTYVTKCTPYTSKPTMTRLHTEDALIVFSFSSQYIN